ncbi:unnamed protein product, partial [Sphacelaria rigidula]
VLAGVIGCLQATESLKVLGEFGEPLSGKMCTYDAQDGSFYQVRLRPRYCVAIDEVAPIVDRPPPPPPPPRARGNP